VANQIAAGEVVERPASVVKELVENAIDAGAKKISIVISQGGRKLVSVQDDGCGMSKDDAVLSLERQATSKILNVADILKIDTLGFRGEAIPSIASVSRFTLTTRRGDSDEGTMVQVNAGTLAEVRAAGCPPGTLVEVRDLFCNVPARKKFLRAYVTEENHIRHIFTVHALAHPQIGFSLTCDNRELYRLAPAESVHERVRELFGEEFLENASPMDGSSGNVKVSGLIERPNLSSPTRRDQYIFVNGRPATSPSIAYALREAYPHRTGDSRPAAIVFVDLPPDQVDVNVHPTKREVRFRDNTSVKNAIIAAVEHAVSGHATAALQSEPIAPTPTAPTPQPINPTPQLVTQTLSPVTPTPQPAAPITPPIEPMPSPIPLEFAIEPDSSSSKPWVWFKFLAQSASGYLLIETDAGIVTVNPHAARERIAYERLMTHRNEPSQALLIPETVKLSPIEAARIRTALSDLRTMGFQIEEFGHDTFKVDAIPQLTGSLAPSSIIATIARDLAEGGTRRGERWREELIAKSIANSFAGSSMTLTADGATKLIEELCACKMPYVCPRGKPVMIFTSTRELDRKFARN